MQLMYNIVLVWGAAAAKSLQLCPTLCDTIHGSPPGSPVPGILQARTLEWVAISFSNAWKWKVKVKSFSHVLLLAIPWTAPYQAPSSMGFSRQEYWSAQYIYLIYVYIGKWLPHKFGYYPSLHIITIFYVMKILKIYSLSNFQRYSG